MSIQCLSQFNQQVIGEPALQEKLAQVSSREAFVATAVELGREKGFSFSAEEIEDALAEKSAWKLEDAWDLDERLEQVAGKSPGNQDTTNDCTATTTALPGCCH